MIQFLPLLSKGLDLLSSLTPEQKAKAKAELISAENAATMQELEVQMKAIVAEANSESWIARNWRPITMLTFVGLIVAKWLGFTSGVTDEVEIALLNIVQVGLGGYVIGRSAEKVMKEWKR